MKRMIKGLLKKAPYVRDLQDKIARQGVYPAGHYYSPIPDRQEILEYVERRKAPRLELPDVPLNKELQFELLNEYAVFYKDVPFPESQSTTCRYYYDNIWFRYADAIFLYSFLRKHVPKRIIEVGSGFSSAVILDTVDGFFPSRPEITFIEPHPDRLRRLLRSGDDNQVRIIDQKIQAAPGELFSSLQSGDFLFIDSSHVLKSGSDLQVLMFEILPMVPAGVFVHFHDVFYPFDYPDAWLREGRYWNESYFLRAFLSYNHDWSVYFFNTYVAVAFSDFIKDKMPLCQKDPGGSLYIQRVKKSR